jgi:hypothetical protein
MTSFSALIDNGYIFYVIAHRGVLEVVGTNDTKLLLPMEIMLITCHIKTAVTNVRRG